MEKKKMNAVAAMAIVLMILLSSNTDTVRVAAQGVNCYDSCNTACVGLPCTMPSFLPFITIPSIESLLVKAELFISQN
uniref:Uncharacterized protein n=1 Tax=Solanum tuberosum TaxID=4113 RepID=M1CWW5_SOLTU